MKLRKYIFLFLLMIGLSVTAQPAGAKSYRIPNIKIEVAVRPNGTIRITEHRTYIFDGSFSWADYRLPLKGFTNIHNIEVREQGKPFINRNDEQPGTFEVQKKHGMLKVKWFYHARNEKRTFTISYTLDGAVVVGPRWCEFFWNYLSAHRKNDTKNLHISLRLPHSMAAESLHGWKRGPGSKINLQTSAQGYTVSASNIGDDEFVKVRFVFPRSVFNEHALAINDAGFSLAQAKKDEHAHQIEQRNHQILKRRHATYGRILAILVSLLSIVTFVLLYRTYGKRYPIGSISTSESMVIPGHLRPAIAGWLLRNRSVSSLSLMGTLLDLARRGYFVIKEEEPEKGFWGKKKKIFSIEENKAGASDALTAWESSLIDFVKKQIEAGNQGVDKLFSGNSRKSAKWYKSWKKQVEKDCKSHHWIDQKSYKGVYANIVSQFILAGGGIMSAIWAGPVGIVPLVIIFILLILSSLIIRRTSQGEETYSRWDAYRKGLKNAEHYTIEHNMLGKHFIYALSFGLSKKKIEALFNQCDESSIVFHWFIFFGGGAHSPAAITSTFSTLGASGAAAFPGASAGAAGAAAGAAGGGAAGGAG